jgi:ABC-type molybdate transport system substrate-binding protein
MVLLKRAGKVATAFYAFVQGDAARAILRKHGFAVPE